MATDERRTAILHCAARLFSHYGPSKTTIADIAREAQVGIGTVYLVFPSKEAIVEELSSSAHMRVLQAMREVASARQRETIAERLAGVLEIRVTMFQKLAEEGQHACELVHCTKGGPVKAAHARFRDDERALFQQLFEAAQRAGELSGIEPSRAAGLVQRAYATLSPPWLFEEESPDEARRVAYEMCRLLLVGLEARPSRVSVDKQSPRPARRR